MTMNEGATIMALFSMSGQWPIGFRIWQELRNARGTLNYRIRDAILNESDVSPKKPDGVKVICGIIEDW